MRRQMVAGNWKMHGSRAANQALLAELEMKINADWPIDIVVFPPYVYLSDAVRMLEDGRIAVGAQDVCAESGGAYTGQVSAAMLKDVGCSYVIVGHSERRRWYHEDDALVARKFAAVLDAGLTPVLCIGETLDEREAKQTGSGDCSATRRGDRDARGRRFCAGDSRLRAGVGHRDGPHGLAGAGAGGALLPARSYSRARC